MGSFHGCCIDGAYSDTLTEWSPMVTISTQLWGSTTRHMYESNIWRWSMMKPREKWSMFLLFNRLYPVEHDANLSAGTETKTKGYLQKLYAMPCHNRHWLLPINLGYFVLHFTWRQSALPQVPADKVLAWRDDRQIDYWHERHARSRGVARGRERRGWSHKSLDDNYRTLRKNCHERVKPIIYSRKEVSSPKINFMATGLARNNTMHTCMQTKWVSSTTA